MGNNGADINCGPLLLQCIVRWHTHDCAILTCLAYAYAGGRAYELFLRIAFPGCAISCALAFAEALAYADVLGDVHRKCV